MGAGRQSSPRYYESAGRTGRCFAAPRIQTSKAIGRQPFRIPTTGRLFWLPIFLVRASPQSERTRAHRGIAPRLAFCYSVGRAPLTLPVAHVQSKLAPIFTSGTEVTKNVESQEDPARILP